MAYTVLARKYRSATFDDLVGQEHVSRTLKRAITSDRIAHAFLFTGTRGTGKTSSARILAKCLNCEAFDKPTPTPCGKCNSCLGIARGDDIDVVEIDAASNTQVEKTREIIENAQYRPARARFKIYIIDEVHMLSKASFNALLKTLEEPPEHVKFILATTEVEKVLPTILSRCQRYDFRNIPTREIAKHLAEVCAKEGIGADDDAVQLVAKAGAGSMRDALSLLDRLLSTGDEKLTTSLIEQMLGLPKTQLIFDLAQTIGSGDVAGTLVLADQLITQGFSPETLVSSLTDHLRNLMVIRACGAQTTLVEVPGLPLEQLVQQAEQFDTLLLGQDIALLEELRRQLRTSAAGRALVDATFVRLALAEQFTSIADLIGATNHASGDAGAGGSAVQKKKPELSGGYGATSGSATGASASSVAPRDVIASTPSTRATSANQPSSGTGIANPSLDSVDDTTSLNDVAALSSDSSGNATVSDESATETSTSSDDDALPAVGKVADADAVSSLWQAQQRRRAANSQAGRNASSTTSAPSSNSSSSQNQSSRPSPPIAGSQGNQTTSAHPDSNVAPADDDLQRLTTRLLATMTVDHPHIVGFLDGGRVVTLDDHTATLRYPAELVQSVKMLERNGKKETLQDVLSHLLGRTVGIRFEFAAAAAPASVTEIIEASAPVADPPPVKQYVDPNVPLTEELHEELRRNNPLLRAVEGTLGGVLKKVEEP